MAAAREELELTVQALNDMLLRRENEILQLQIALLRATALLNGHPKDEPVETVEE